MVKFKVGDKVRLNSKLEVPNRFCINVNTVYEIEYIATTGALVLKDHYHLVDPAYVELSPQPIIGYYRRELNMTNPISPIFLSHDDAELTIVDNVYTISEIEIDRNSLLNYIREHNLLD